MRDPPNEDNCTSTTTYIGGSSWSYDFMEGLENYNGTFLTDIDPDIVAKAEETTFEVNVSIDDDGICTIDVGNETCSACSIDDCGGGGGGEDDNDDDSTDIPTTVSFDCTNVPNGRASTTCEPVDGIFYPLMFTNNDDSILKEDNESTLVEGLDVDGSLEGTTSSSSTSTSTATCGLLSEGTLPQDGAACDAAMPEGTSSIGCTDMSYAGLTQTDRSCTCESSDPIWKCTSISTEIEPNQSCPPQDQPKASGDSCAGQLSQPMSSMTCMWSQQVSSSATVSSISCECKRGAAGSSTDDNEVWSCDGTYPPIIVDTPTLEKENNDTDVTDVGVMTATDETSKSSSASTAVSYFVDMAVVFVAVITTTATTF